MYKEKLSVNSEYKRICSFLIPFFCFLLFIGCSNPFSFDGNLPAPPEGKGSFSLILSNTARTVLPATPGLGDFARYNLAFTPINGGEAASVDRTNDTINKDPVLLVPGTYSLVVSAYKDANKTLLAAQGTLNSISITAGNKTSASVTLKALLSGGTGAFSWDISVPSDVASAKMTITPGGTGGSAQEAVSLNVPKSSGNRNLNSGQYNVTINLGKAGGETVVWKELLYVYRNLESGFSFTFTDAYFSGSIYTVTFNSNGGDSGNLVQSVLHGGTINKPADPSRNGYVFGGWYADENTFTKKWDFNKAVIESFTLYAKWEPGLGAKLAELQTTAQTGGNYTIEVNADESIDPQYLFYSGRTHVNITLKGVGANRTISLSSNGSMFTVGSGVNLHLSENITLQGHNGNSSSLVFVNSGGTLQMHEGSIITGNGSAGVSVAGGTFYLTGGTVSGNTNYSDGNGGGVSVQNGNFGMYSGIISGNTSEYGGGVYISSNSSFAMSGGEIYGNTAGMFGGGLYAIGSFNKNGGTITGYASDKINGNVVTEDESVARGHAVYAFYNNSVFRYKNTTAGPGENLYFNGTTNPPEYTGYWDDKDDDSNVPGSTLADKLKWLQDNAQSNTEYTIKVNADESIGNYGFNFSNSGKSGVTITLIGVGSNRTISLLSTYNTMFAIWNGVTLVLDNITLKGHKNSDLVILVSLYSGGNLIMNDGSAITDSGGDGVYMFRLSHNGTFGGADPTFTMNGGAISNNERSGVEGEGYFTMNGGIITGNTAFMGGGVNFNGTFTMNGGDITDNIGDPGGVYVSGGTFIMNGGSISNNKTAYYYGGGVEVAPDGTFEMRGGYIYNNTANLEGGGVNVQGIFNMSGGYIYGNKAITNNGGGVAVWPNGIFNMSGGEIHSNTAGSSGGGVYVYRGIFDKTGGTITGYDNDTIRGNRVMTGNGLLISNRGHAVSTSSPSYSNLTRKETTAGPNVNLYYDGRDGTFYGSWDSLITVSFTGLSIDGSVTETTTKLTLTFDRDVPDFSVADITLSGATGAAAGALNRLKTGVYELALSGIKAAGQVMVGVSKEGYNFSPASRGANVYFVYVEPVSFNSLTANGSASSATNLLTLTFDKDIPGLTASNITFSANNTGATAGTFTKKGTGVYELAVHDIKSTGHVSVGVSMAGYSFSPASLSVLVHCLTPQTGTAAGLASLSFAQIIDDAPSLDSGITIYRSNNKTPTSAIFTVQNPSQYSSITWFINGTSIKAQSLTIYSMSYNNYSVGEHYLTLEVVMNGRTYSKRVTFNVAN